MALDQVVVFVLAAFFFGGISFLVWNAKRQEKIPHTADEPSGMRLDTTKPQRKESADGQRRRAG